MKNSLFFVVMILFCTNTACSQSTTAPVKKRIAVDVAHAQIFWGDPSNPVAKPASKPDRQQFLASKLLENALQVNADVVFLDKTIGAEQLEGADLLFIHVPSSPYSEPEVTAIRTFLKQGGSLFLVQEVDYWTTLAKSNVNDLIQPFGIRFGADSPDTLVGATTRAGLVTEKALKIPYHGGRIVTGGTPFCFTVGPNPVAFGAFAELDGGGRLVIMGEGMASLYMNSWQGVDDYQTEAFMGDVLKWLLKR